jgi:hypothetical protein
VDDEDEFICSSPKLHKFTTSAKITSSSSQQTPNPHFKNLIGLKKKIL